MKELNQEKGITLVALIITIIVLLILAVVAISAVTGDGIIAHAKNARYNYQAAQGEENTALGNYMIELNNAQGEAEIDLDTASEEETLSSDVTIAKTAGTVYESNTQITDAYGNKITIPSGFKLASDSGNDVTKGIVIEDVNNGNVGSQFVWVPVGTVYTNEAQTESKPITLNRYTFASDGTPTEQGDMSITTNNRSYQELASSSSGNTTAKNINAFKTSVTNNGGYYIGRYEAGDSSASSARSSSTNGTLVCKANQEVYNYITQSDAAIKCRNMYTSSNFTSDLVNSYAWDTAIVYIQKFGGDSNYSNHNYSTCRTTAGGNRDEYCRINDMSGNVYEWTTETCLESYCCVTRGGFWAGSNQAFSSNYRYNSSTWDNGNGYTGFRPILYI